MRTLFHSKQILTKNPENTDKRVRFLKAGRFFVCVLMLLAMSGAAWGAEYRWKPEGDTTGNMEWSSVNNWQSAVWPNGNSSDVPGGDDRVFIRGSGTETVIKLTGETSLDELIINSDNAGSHVVRIIAENPTVFNIIKLYLALPGDASAFTLILEDVSLSCTTIEVNNDTNNHKNGGEFIISGTGSSSISATTVNIYADAATSPGSMKIDFGNVPMTATNVNVNAAEKTGTVEIATDSSITVEGCMNIGKYDQNGNNGTKTVFSGSGSVTTETLDFPNANNHELTIEEGVALGFSSGGTFYQDTSGSITINGSGTIDFQNAGIDTTNNDKPQGLHISPDTIVLNPPGNNTYTMTVGTMTGFPSSSVQSVTIHIVASTTESSLNDRYKKFLYTFSQNGNQFTFNGNNNASSQIQLSSGSGNSYSGDFTLSYNNSGLSAGNGFTLTIYRPDGIVLGTVSWYQGVPGWTGASSTAWNTLGNWTGITDLGDLSTKDISINSSAQNQPEISTDVQVKTLTITNNATVTQTEGSFSVESITCQGTGKFIEDGGTVQFNGSDGTYSAVYNGDTYFNNVSIESGKKLTLNSDLYLKGNLTVNGTLTQNGKSLVFRGSSQSISGVTSLDAITVKNGATVTLGADFTVGKLTVESGGTLDCSGHTLTITDSSTIAGTVTAEKCIATGMGGKTLTINGTLSVSDTLTLEGTDADHKLVITGVGTIKLAASQTGGKWLDVTYGTVPVVHDSSDGTTVTYTASYSSGPATNPTGWKIFSGASAYTWTGNAGSNDWGTAGNWDVNAVPDENSDVVLNEDAECETPAGTAVTVKTLTLTDDSAMITLLGDLTVTESITNDGCLDTNGHTLIFKTYDSPMEDGLVVVSGASSLVPTTSGTSAGTINWLEFAGDTSFENVSKLTFVNANVSVLAPATSTVVTLSGDLTFTGELNNASVIDTNGHTLTFKVYDDASPDESALIKMGAAGGIALYTGGSAQTISNVEFTGNRTFTDSTSFSFVNATVASGVDLTLSSDLTLTGLLSNAGTVNTNSHKLTFGSYSDTSGSESALVQIAADNALALYSGGTGGEIKNLEFTGTSSFKDLSGLTIRNVTVNSGVELKMIGGCTFGGTLENKGTINLNQHQLSFAAYTHTGTDQDKVLSNGGKIVSTGGGTGTASISTVQVSTGLSVTNFGSGDLKLTSTTFTGTVSLTIGSGSGPTPEFVTINNNGKINLADNNLSWSSAYNGTSGGTDEVSVSGTVTVGPTGSGTGTIGVFSVSDTATVSGTFSCMKFTGTNLGGKTLTINGTVTVGSGNTDETLELSGASASSRLTVRGNGTIKLNVSQVGGDYLDLSQSPRPSIADGATETGVICTATHSTGTSGNGWNICTGDLVYEWVGGDGTTDAQHKDWSRPKNWTAHIVPGIISGKSYAVKIPASASEDVSVTVVVTVTSLEIETGRTLTQQENVVISDALINSGTINMNGKNLTFASYSDTPETGVIKIGTTGVITPTGGAAYVGTINKLIFTGTRTFSTIPKLIFKNAEVGASGGTSITLTLGNDITFTGTLTNYGTIDMQNNNLTCASYTDDGNNRWIKLGTGSLTIDSSSTLNNIEFTASRNGQGSNPGVEDIPNLTITNGKVDSPVTIQVTSGGLTFAGNLTNNGTIVLGGNLTVGGTLDNTHEIDVSNTKTLQFASYSHTGTATDILKLNNGGGAIKATGAAGTVSALILEGVATVTNSGSGSFRFTTTTVNADVTLSAGGSGSAPLFCDLNITGGKTLIFDSDVTVVNVTIAENALLKAGSSVSATNTLTIRGDFTNNNVGANPSNPEAVPTVSDYPGFVAQNGTVKFVENPDHYIHGFNIFNNFTCEQPGATLYFDAGKTIRIEKQLILDGERTDTRIKLNTPPGSDSGKQWTLDITRNAYGAMDHPDPVINCVEPHHSISYRAILSDALVGCQDDGDIDIDSTNSNWFDSMPRILMTLAPVGGKQLFVLFSTIVEESSTADFRTAIALKSSTESNIIKSVAPYTSYNGSSDRKKTALVFELTREITWNDIAGANPLYIEIVLTDAVHIGGSIIPYLAGTKHCASDYAVNAVKMLFGYDNFIDSSTPLTIEKGTNSVRTWDQSDSISNRLHSDSELLFQSQFDASVPTDMKLEMIAMLASQLNTSVISDNYKDYYNLSARLWLPDEQLALSSQPQIVPSAQTITQSSTSAGSLRNFSLHYDKSSSSQLFKMNAGEEIQFLFKIKNPDGTDFTIDHDCDEDPVNNPSPTPRKPLFAIRLVDDTDITSFDLWSVMLESTTLQRGNVTILNNVINSDQKEETFVTIQMQKAGSLTVQVLTLDGSVITTLQRGRKEAGTYGYSWDGSNGKGRPVSRGMYFIRVIGPDIDETRKVMVVRD